MTTKASIWDARKGWIFCLNSTVDSDSGSMWGYVESFLLDIEVSGQLTKQKASMKSSVYGKPCAKALRMHSGDAIVFYHGKKARREQVWPKKGPKVNPYQLTMAALIADVTQDNLTGEVSELEFEVPRDLFDSMRHAPLLLSDDRVRSVVESTGLGGGAVGTFFPIAPNEWNDLREILRERV